jgi:glycosyltransferase involved in cell wall biosynthesis
VCFLRRAKKIVILNGNHLCHNPRVIKEADCLAAAGFDVEVLGAWLNENLIARDRDLMSRQRFRYNPVVQLDAGMTLGGTLLRGRRWMAFMAKRWLGRETPDILGYGVGALLKAARSRDADLYIAHSEPALWAARELSLGGRRIGVDMEDWFSEDLSSEARRGRPVKLLRELESSVLAASAHATCTSRAMGAALASAYGCPEPLVIYNAFPWAERERLDGQIRDRRNMRTPSIHWYSQSIGPGRGLEDLFAALRLLEVKAEVHLRGSLWHGYREWLDRLVPESWRERVFFHAVVPNDELLSRIAEHDIGVSLDPSVPQSRNVTVTNKILQFMQAGLAVVATSTLGQLEVAAQSPAAVRLCGPGDAAGLAEQLTQLLTQPAALAEAKRASLAAAREVFSWEKAAPLLVASVERAVAARS